jgi:succinate dehydrogenase / fumarate reductase flavoprotein subunit
VADVDRVDRARVRFRSTEGGENPYTVHELQQTMNDLVGIIRRDDEMELALEAAGRGAAETWWRHGLQPRLAPALDLRNMLLVSSACRARSSAREPRRPHPRRLPGDGSDWRTRVWPARLARTRRGGPPGQVPMRPDLLELFERRARSTYEASPAGSA